MRRAVEDLASIRAGKLRRWMQATVRSRMNAVKVENMTSLEVESHRPILPHVLDKLYTMHVPDADLDAAAAPSSVGTSSAANTSAAQTAQPPRPARRMIRRGP